MADLTGKRLGKIVVLAKERVSDDHPGRFKYGSLWYRIKCDCGVEKMIPTQGAAGTKSCGCARSAHIKSAAIETTRYFPNRVKLESVRDQIYEDI